LNKSGKIIAAVLAAIILFSVGGFIASFRNNKKTADETTVVSTSNDTTQVISTEDTVAAGSEEVDSSTTGVTAALTKTPATTKPSVSDTATGEYAYAYAGFNPKPAVIDSATWNLLLVNRNYILPEDFTVTLAKAASGYDTEMDARAAVYYTKMFNAAKSENITLVPLSGHRRISTQKTNFENKINYYINQGNSKVIATQKAAQIILPPGCSEHNAGLAMDINPLDGKNSLVASFDTTKEFKWLSENAVEYGFILRYPKEKFEITQITYEPWHWRYVGVEAAQEMKASGQCLEEYLNKANS
jgi:zinc D-Ala-D-Ala carboxypeptidase